MTAGKPGPAAEVAVPFDDTIRDALGSKAREHHTYVVFGGVFLDDLATGACSNAAIVIDRQGREVGRYVKVHPVLDRVGPDGKIVLEGGVQPGRDYNVFDLDFGRVGLQICYDVEYSEGWQRLAERGAELVLYPTQSPQLTRPGMYAATHEYWVVAATFRNNASFFEPGTGLVAAQITEPKQTLVHEIDLSYLILPWTSRLPTVRHFARRSATALASVTPSPKIVASSGQTTQAAPLTRWLNRWASSKQRPSSRLAHTPRRIACEVVPHVDRCCDWVAVNCLSSTIADNTM